MMPKTETDFLVTGPCPDTKVDIVKAGRND
jgi:hypothetical protein